MKEKEPTAPLGIPVSDPPVPNRARTEMRLPARNEPDAKKPQKPKKSQKNVTEYR